MFTENAYDLKSPTDNSQNTQFNLHIDAGYDLGIASISVGIETDVNFRSAFAVRQRFAPEPDRPGQDAVIETALDSQSGVDVELELKIDLGLFSLNPHFTIWNAQTANQPKPLVVINYSPNEDSNVASFSVAGQTLDAGATMQQCLAPPAQLSPITPPSDPGELPESDRPSGSWAHSPVRSPALQ